MIVEDRTMEKIHKTLPLPQYSFYSEFDVLEKHIGKPIPILYGELEKAPSIIYTESTTTEDMYANNNLLLMYDNAPLAGHSVRGCKKIIPANTLNDLETGILYIKDGEKYLEVPYRPYNNLQPDTINAHNYPQFNLSTDDNGDPTGSYIQLVSNYQTDMTLLGTQNVIWCHYLDYPISKIYLQSHVDAYAGQDHQGGAWNTDHHYYAIGDNEKYKWTEGSSSSPSTPYEVGRTLHESTYWVDGVCVGYSFKPFSLQASQWHEIDPIDGKEMAAIQCLAIQGNFQITFNVIKSAFTRQTTWDVSTSHTTGQYQQVGYYHLHYFPFPIHYDEFKNSVNNFDWYGMYHFPAGAISGWNDMVNCAGRIEQIHQGEQDWQATMPTGIRIGGEDSIAGGLYEGEYVDNYRNYFTRASSGQENTTAWRILNEWETGHYHEERDRDYPVYAIDSNNLSFFIHSKPADPANSDWWNWYDPWHHKTLVRPVFHNLSMRRYFNITEGLSKDFYVNAIGRDDNENYTNLPTGKGPMIYPSGQLRVIFALNDDFDNEQRIEQSHEKFFKFYEYVSDPQYRYRYRNGKRQVRAIKIFADSMHRIYVIDPKILHVNFLEETGAGNTSYLEVFLEAEVYAASHIYTTTGIQNQGWQQEIDEGNPHRIWDFYEGYPSHPDNDSWTSYAQRLMYIEMLSPDSMIESDLFYDPAPDEDQTIYAIRDIELTSDESPDSEFGFLFDMDDMLITQDPDGDDEVYANANGGNPIGYFKWSEDAFKNPVLYRPSEIIHHLLNNELNYTQDININRFRRSGIIHNDWKMSFSVNKPTDSKKVIENICRQSKMAATFRVGTGEFSTTDIKQEYFDQDVGLKIDTRDIIKMSVDRTKPEDIILKCRVLYGYDYATNDYKKATKFIQPSDPQPYFDYYGIESVEDNLLELRADYIQDHVTAKLLRDYHFNMWKNQHSVLKINLPLIYSHLEVADIIAFDVHEEFSFKSIYGKQIDESYIKIGQEIYPYYMVTKIKKGLDFVELELFQLHKLSYYLEETENEDFDVIGGEIEEEEEPEEELEYILGDVNGDESVDVLDVVLMVNYILGSAPLTDDQWTRANYNGDNMVDVLDVVLIVNEILGI